MPTRRIVNIFLEEKALLVEMRGPAVGDTECLPRGYMHLIKYNTASQTEGCGFKLRLATLYFNIAVKKNILAKKISQTSETIKWCVYVSMKFAISTRPA